MRSIWKGAVTFGLVNVPVKLYAATEDHDVPLHQVHHDDGGRIRYQRRCEVCGEVVPYSDIDRAYQDGENTVVLREEDLDALPAERNREIEVLEFVPSDQVDPITFDKAYYLEPDSQSPKAYVLLRKTLERSDRTAIVKFSLRQRTRLGALHVRGEVLMLQTLLWSDELRQVSFGSLEAPVKISDRELELSSSLVDSFASDFDPSEYVDEYQQELRALIEQKLDKGDAVKTPTPSDQADTEPGGEVIDLMSALQASIERSRAARKDTGEPEKTDTAKGTARSAKTEAS